MKDLFSRILKNNLFRFLIVGGCATLVDFVVYMLLSARIDITLSKAISMILSSIFSYFVNKNFTFNNRDKTNVSYIVRFYIVFAANLAVNLGINFLVFYRTGQKLPAYILATAGGMTVNYLGQRFLVFNRKNKDKTNFDE